MRRKDEKTGQGQSGGKNNFTPVNKTNYTPYIIGGVILLAILAAIIF
jgi:hypothetical protein